MFDRYQSLPKQVEAVIHGELAIIRVGDWIIKDAEIGTYYPVKDEIFRNQYV